MRSRRTTTIQDLRNAIDCLPRQTRAAMLHGINTNPIIVGAYTHDDGICPMLAAHRAGGRTSFISFARAWDGFAFRGARGGRARRATERELLTLRTHLEASLLADDAPQADLAAAMGEHRKLLALRERESPANPTRHGRPPVKAPAARPARERPGDPDRSGELRRRGGWRWMRVVRSLEDYERVLGSLQSEHEAQQERESLLHR
jgi:hypothetical protein